MGLKKMKMVGSKTEDCFVILLFHHRLCRVSNSKNIYA